MKFLAIIFATAFAINVHYATTAQAEQDIAEHQRFVALFTGVESDEDLPEMGPRSTREQRRKSVAFLSMEMEARGLEVQLHRYAHTNIHPALDLLLPPMRGVNVFTKIDATIDTNQYVIVGAHYDTERNSPGADDNASGVSAVLSIATRISNLEQRYVNYIFVLFDQEEDDLGPGSKTFAQLIVSRGYVVHSMHNVDMIGYDGNRNRTLEVEVPNSKLEHAYQYAADKRGMHLTFVQFNSSDHVAFRNLGIDAVCVGEEVSSDDLNPFYHTPDDTIEHIDFEFLARASLVIGDVLAQIGAP